MDQLVTECRQERDAMQPSSTWWGVSVVGEVVRRKQCHISTGFIALSHLSPFYIQQLCKHMNSARLSLCEFCQKDSLKIWSFDDETNSFIHSFNRLSTYYVQSTRDIMVSKQTMSILMELTVQWGRLKFSREYKCI